LYFVPWQEVVGVFVRFRAPLQRNNSTQEAADNKQKLNKNKWDNKEDRRQKQARASQNEHREGSVSNVVKVGSDGGYLLPGTARIPAASTSDFQLPHFLLRLVESFESPCSHARTWRITTGLYFALTVPWNALRKKEEGNGRCYASNWQCPRCQKADRRFQSCLRPSVPFAARSTALSVALRCNKSKIPKAPVGRQTSDDGIFSENGRQVQATARAYRYALPDPW
jgi:hypothetical protein